MRQPLNTEELNPFLADVYALKLRFPVVMIARATGDSRGNVSRYIRGQAPASPQFLQRFYASFKKELLAAGIPDRSHNFLPPPAPAQPIPGAPDHPSIAAIDRRLAEIAHALKELEQRQSTTERFMLEYLSNAKSLNSYLT